MSNSSFELVLTIHITCVLYWGVCIGFAWLILTIWLFEFLKKKTDKEMQSKAG